MVLGSRPPVFKPMLSGRFHDRVPRYVAKPGVSMNQDVMEQVLRCTSLPTLPAVAVEVLELTDNPDVSLAQLARVIQNDQGLAAKVIRIVNSSFYGMRHKCATIHQAMAMLGLSTVKSLALGFSLVTCLEEHQAEGFDYVAYWRRQLYGAIGAREAAHRAMPKFENEAFLGGLFQDIGMIALYSTLGPIYAELLRESGPSHRGLAPRELAALEAQHPDVGALLAARWKLPPSLVAPIKYHERPTAAPAEWAGIVRCVAIGGLVHDVLTDSDPKPAFAELRERSLEWLEMGPAEVDSMVDASASSTRALASILRLNTGTFPDTESILEQAKARAASAVVQADSTEPDDIRLQSLVADSDTHDPLTGALQRRSFEHVLDGLFEAASTSGNPLALVQVHIDDFTRRACEFGQARADDILAAAGAIIMERLEPVGASVCRWARDTFAFALMGVNVRRVGELVGMIRHDLAGGGLMWAADVGDVRQVRVTISIGAATLDASTRNVLTRRQQLVSASMQAVAACRSAGGDCFRTFIRQAA